MAGRRSRAEATGLPRPDVHFLLLIPAIEHALEVSLTMRLVQRSLALVTVALVLGFVDTRVRHGWWVDEMAAGEEQAYEKR